MANVYSWTITQIGGTEKIELANWAAPYGRPRQKPVVTTGKSLRKKRVQYPGSNETTTHLFGTNQKGFQLEGRWMDKRIGAGAALQLVQRFEKLVDDMKPVLIEWGPFLSYTGFIEEVEAKWESTAECAWTLHFVIDKNNLEAQIKLASRPRDDAGKAAVDISDFLDEGVPAMSKHLASLDSLTGELVDFLDDAVGNVTQFGSLAARTAASISSFESASASELKRFLAELHQFKTAVLILQDTVDSVKIDRLIIDRQAEDDIAWLSFKSSADVRTTKVQASVASTTLAINRALQGQIITSYVAKLGDTWESISTIVYHGPDGADRIRKANGIKHGQQPLVGKTYQIPQQ